MKFFAKWFYGTFFILNSVSCIYSRMNDSTIMYYICGAVAGLMIVSLLDEYRERK